MSVDKKAIAHSFSKAAPCYDSVAHVQRQVGEAMLSVLANRPERVEAALDIGCGTGALTTALAAYADHITALDLAPGMLQVARANDRAGVINEFLCGDAEQLPFAGPQFDLVFSSFALQWCDDLAAVLDDVYKILQPGGRFVWSIPVANTLRELKQSWQRAESQHQHVNDFLSVAAVQELIARSPFASGVVQEKLDVVRYDSVRELIRELKTLGAHQVTSNRTLTLTGKQTLSRMLQHYEQWRDQQGLLPASWHYLVIELQKPAV